jgi:hypothetical protein
MWRARGLRRRAAARFAIGWFALHLSVTLNDSLGGYGRARILMRARSSGEGFLQNSKKYDFGIATMNMEIKPMGRGILAAVVALVLLLGGPRGVRSDSRGGAGTAGISQQKTKKAKAPATSASKDVAVPFRAGEKLNYQVAWSAFLNAASVQLNVPERRDLYGWSTWHFRASMHTQGTARNLFVIDDQFDSYTDAAMTESRQFETYLNEMGRKQEQVLHFIAEGETSKAPGPSVIVLAGTRDPLGAFYAMRTVDWQRTPEVRTPVYDGRNVYEMRAKMEAAKEDVKVAAGSFAATRVSVEVLQNGKEMSAISITVWLANDAARTPVVMQAEMPFGNVRAELTSVSQ